MSYTKRLDVPADSGWMVVELDEGDLVAVTCRVVRCNSTSNRVFCPRAVQVNAAGQPKLDDDGQVETEHRYSCPEEIFVLHGEAAISRETLLLVLGEPPTTTDDSPLIPWSIEVQQNSSIRRAIAAARSAGVAQDIDGLL